MRIFLCIAFVVPKILGLPFLSLLKNLASEMEKNTFYIENRREFII